LWDVVVHGADYVPRLSGYGHIAVLSDAMPLWRDIDDSESSSIAG
jgi:hypothetical protein